MADLGSLGRRVAVHPIGPAHMQRAVFITVLSFMFFLAMMFAFYLRQNLVYFLLATAFLLVYLVMMFSLVMMRRSAVEVCERGFKYRKNAVPFDEIGSLGDSGEVVLKDRRKIVLPKSAVEFERLLVEIRSHLG